MRSRHVALGLAAVALVIAGAAWVLDPGRGCAPEAGCMDERGPLHPALAFTLTFATFVPVAAGAWWRRRWLAGVAFWPTLACAGIAAIVLEYAFRGPTPLLAWAWPLIALLLVGATVALAFVPRE